MSVGRFRPAAFFMKDPRSHPGTLPFTTRGTSVRCSANDELQNADHPGGPGGGIRLLTTITYWFSSGKKA